MATSTFGAVGLATYVTPWSRGLLNCLVLNQREEKVEIKPHGCAPFQATRRLAQYRMIMEYPVHTPLTLSLPCLPHRHSKNDQ